MKDKPTSDTQSKNRTRDLIVISVLSILAYAFSAYFHACEAFFRWYKEHNGDEWQIDELFVVFIILALGFGAFSFRSWRDIKRGIKIQGELAHSRDDALESTRLKSEFLANMSHELRTPMNGIIGFTELTLSSDLSSEQRDNLNIVKASAESLMIIMEDILDFSKIEAGKLDLEATNFSVRDCLDGAIKSLAIRASEKNLELALDISQDVTDALVGDSGRLRQIILNLAGNAIKFTETGGVTVHVQTRAQSEDEVCLQLSVTDTGIGIAKSKQALIFNSFTQADGSTTRKYGGTGLGLAISTQLVEMMGGEMWVDSEPGQGSTFHFIARFGLQASPVAPHAIVKELRTIPKVPLQFLSGLGVALIDWAALASWVGQA